MNGHPVLRHPFARQPIPLSPHQLLLQGISYAKIKNTPHPQTNIEQQQKEEVQVEKEEKEEQVEHKQVRDEFDIDFSVESLDDLGMAKPKAGTMLGNHSQEQAQEDEWKDYIQINKDHIKEIEQDNHRKKEKEAKQKRREEQKIEKAKQAKVEEKRLAIEKEAEREALHHQYDHLQDYYQDNLGGQTGQQLMEFLNHYSSEEEEQDSHSLDPPPPRSTFQPTQIQEFKFTNKDWANSIRVRRVQQMLDEKEQALLQEMDYKFKANPLPAHVKMALFDDIHRKTKLKDRPNKQQEHPTEPPHNKAPWMLFDHQSIMKRVKDRARDTLDQADRNVYPRMKHNVAHKRQFDQQIEAKRNTRPTQQLDLHDVPDFQYLHRRFQDQLQRIRVAQTLTQFQPFNVTDKVPSQKLHCQPKAQQKPPQGRADWKKILKKGFAPEWATTKNQEVYQQHLRTQELKEKDKADKREQERKKRKADQDVYKQKVQDKLKYDTSIREKENQQKQKLYKMEQQTRSRQYKQEVDQIQQRVQQRGFMMEQKQDGRYYEQRLKRVLQYVDGLSMYQAKRVLPQDDYGLYQEYLQQSHQQDESLLL